MSEEQIPVEDEYLEENENNETEEVKKLIEQINEVVVYGTDWTVGTIIEQIKAGNINVNPCFQRRDAWNIEKKIKYIESLILGFPVPQIVLAEMTRGKFIVIDGKQRLLSLMQFYGIADKTIGKINNFALNKCELLKDLNGISYIELESDPLLNQYYTQLQNQTVRCVLIKNWNQNILLLEKIFVRLNTGSVPLSPHELRLALLNGPFSNYIDEQSYTCKQIHDLLNVKSFDYRMRDAELITRFFSFKFFINDYTGNISEFLNESIKKLNATWDEELSTIQDEYTNFKNGLDFIFKIFTKDNACRKWNGSSYEKRFNRAILDGFIYFLTIPSVLDACKGKEKIIEDKFKLLCKDYDYMESIGVSTKKKSSVITRFNKTCELLESVTSTKIEKPEILK